MNYELRKYSFGETLGKGFNLYFNNFLSIILVSLLCQIPMVIFMRYLVVKPSQLGFNPGVRYFMTFGIFIMTSIIISAFLSAYIIHLVSNKFLENSWLSANSKATSILPLILPIVGLSFLVGLFCMLGFLLLIIPGIIVSLGLSIATTVLVIERRTIIESIVRSWELTKGKKWLIFGFFVVLWIITTCINQPIVVLFKLLIKDYEILTYLNFIISAVTSPIQPCVLVVFYFNLRIEKEGFGIEHLAQQFSLMEKQDSKVEAYY